LGWLISPKAFIADIDKLAQNIFLAASTPAQHAALAAFSSESIEVLESYRTEFKKRRDYLFDAINELGFSVIKKPQGAFYLYADCTKFSDNSFEFANELLEKAGVAITPGIDFGKYKASQHVRFAYTTSLPQLKEGISRLRKHLIA
ncbi:MAG: aminotransferase class I/II-fold pyridoxal phosphate-dependent enzyme, partial [Gammaproteobacteria bacterium]|nr:aminotransferase class I/II-fold pyridoxal phosphate-dependent enzyme [Gammaproteobacteria bacterium]